VINDLLQGTQEELLGRPVRDLLASTDYAALCGQRLLVTGAGGSVGSALARLLAAARPERLTLVDHSEYALFTIEQELRARHDGLDIDAMLGDVTRRVDMRAACRAARPHAVYHAAAYKHVPMAERSIVPAVRVNVLGALEAARAAHEAGARFVLISSDKAAQPRSVMGATKRLAEMAVLGLVSATFRPVAVRFGNILGSSGSLLEIMARCVRDGRRIPVTHPDATRFFMTAGEAASLVLKADLIGGRGTVYWLDMGEPRRIGDLVNRFIARATPRGQAPVGIDVIGLRPGEKMREELTIQGLALRSTAHPKIWAARQRPVGQDAVARALWSIRRAVAGGDAGRALTALETAIDGYSPSSAAWAASRGADPRAERGGRASTTASRPAA
jgi:FlaA1/EpsC-like NDP-sugar epimerase